MRLVTSRELVGGDVVVVGLLVELVVATIEVEASLTEKEVIRHEMKSLHWK